MKRLVWLVIIMMMVTIAGCSSGSAAKIDKVSDLQGKVIGAADPGIKVTDSLIAKITGVQPREVQSFTRFSDCVTALRTGKVDAVFMPKFCAEYSAKRNSDLKIISKDQPGKVSVVMCVRKDDQPLKEELDKAISALQKNGTLKLLADEWITNLPANNEPTSKEIPKIEGAKTVYVGVTGSLAPLDYIAADGRPAGYNVALLTEIGKLMNINFEFVSLEPRARFAALSSKKIDLIFCQLAEAPIENCLITNPYFSSDGASFLVKK
ncbi:MAG: transporter substrate-binding domain-containing protein [Syntrophomonas sp.]